MKPATRRVLDELVRARGAWVCGRVLHSPEVGGWRADARLHELREAGYPLTAEDGNRRVCPCQTCVDSNRRLRARGDEPVRVYAWRLPPSAVQPRLFDDRQLVAP